MKTAGIIGIVLLLSVAGVTTCAYKMYRQFAEFPDEARIENLRQQYPTLYATLEKTVAESTSKYGLAAALETMDLPAGTIYMAMVTNSKDSLPDEDTIELIEQPAGITLTTTIDGAGYGKIGKNRFWIIHYPVQRHNIDRIEIFTGNHLAATE